MYLGRPRRSPRLRGFDYTTPGAYFVTICTQGRLLLFGDIRHGVASLSDAGHMIAESWEKLHEQFPDTEVDTFVVMPNHTHAVIVLSEVQELSGSARVSLTRVIQAFKSRTTVEYARGVRESRWPAFDGKLWQTRYHDHIVRDEVGLEQIRRYIADNPLKWGEDAENPAKNWASGSS